jgi:plastocyanin
MRRGFVVVGLIVALVVATGCGDDSSADGSSADTRADETTTATLSGRVNDEGSRDIAGAGASTDAEVEVDDFSFAPTYLAAATDQRVTVELHNEGDLRHTFTIDSLQVDQELGPGAEATVEVPLPDGGQTLEYFCRFHASQGMRGAFTFAGGATGGGGSSSTSTSRASTGASPY